MVQAKAEAMFQIYPAEHAYKQRVKLKPNEHHYENEGEKPYIKYTCPICEQLAKSVEGHPLYANDEDDENGRFVSFQLQKGIEQCLCCGVNIDWNYK